MMRRFYALLPLLAILLIPTGAWADVWQDPETKVNYEYTPGQSEAGVKKGTGWDSNDQAGCPEASGDIAILSSFTIGGETYTVTEIRNYAFAHCNNLTSVKIPNTINFIGIGAFAECWSLHSINIPESVKYLCPCAFMRCALTSIDIPGSVESIGYQAFLQCSRLETVTIGEGVTTIRGTNVSDHLDGGAFSWCFNLKKVTLPESLKEIGTETFGGCNKLSAIELPKNLEKIGKKAFYGTGNECERFDVYSHIEEPFALNEVFDGNGKNPDENTLYVPAGTKAKYEATDGWKEFKNIVEMAMLDLITGETTVNTEGLGNENLSDNVVNYIYYNVGSEGYDASDKSVVISQTTNMGQITDATPGSSEVKNNFNGLILKVAAGKGTITVNVKTTGNAQLVVQVGNGTPMIASKTEQ
ncbi:MAG: leucine-rich repeat protein, partial [Prevotella sp.]|nr:leucine-rich repeat protein [Prevotella sp.]